MNELLDDLKQFRRGIDFGITAIIHEFYKKYDCCTPVEVFEVIERKIAEHES